MPKIIKVIIVSLFLSAGLSCSGGRIKIKPAPEGEAYILCPVCRGAGVIETYTSKPLQRGVQMDDKEKGCAEFGGCLLSMFDGLTSDNRTEFGQGGEILSRDEERKHLSDPDIYFKPSEQSNVKRIVKCERCDGAGWISRDDGTGTHMERIQSEEGFKRANELLDKK